MPYVCAFSNTRYIIESHVAAMTCRKTLHCKLCKLSSTSSMAFAHLIQRPVLRPTPLNSNLGWQCCQCLSCQTIDIHEACYCGHHRNLLACCRPLIFRPHPDDTIILDLVEEADDEMDEVSKVPSYGRTFERIYRWFVNVARTSS
jgi:hypothetical protein